MDQVPVPVVFAPAGIWKRLFNHILDSIFSTIFVVLVTFILFFIIPGIGLLGIFIYVAYYLITELLWGKTIAKFITGTKVVMADGSKPPFKNILGRSFARLIPFEQFSFLFGKYPVGWHDQLSGTIVVPASYTADDVRRIDYAKLKAEQGNNTVAIVIAVIIGMLVIIAIIGILASVVLVSLNSAREIGKDAQAKSIVNQVTLSLEQYNFETGSLPSGKNCRNGIFMDPLIQSIVNGAPIERELACVSLNGTYAVSALLKKEPSYCKESTGKLIGGGVATESSGRALCEVVQ
jgi:uncharacterized RDD family membrane protein YckC